MLKAILYARGVDLKLINKLKKEAKEKGYGHFGSYLNDLFKTYFLKEE